MYYIEKRLVWSLYYSINKNTVCYLWPRKKKERVTFRFSRPFLACLVVSSRRHTICTLACTYRVNTIYDRALHVSSLFQWDLLLVYRFTVITIVWLLLIGIHGPSYRTSSWLQIFWEIRTAILLCLAEIQLSAQFLCNNFQNIIFLFCYLVRTIWN